MNCSACGGTILPPAVAGVERGSCHCPRGPGHIIGHLFYGTEERPGGWREYEVEFQGEVIKVEPPTLSRAMTVLNDLRTKWRAAQAGAS